jgi:uncharacterized protein YijF (DUF1287 family)
MKDCKGNGRYRKCRGLCSGDIVYWILGGAVTRIRIIAESLSRDKSHPLVVYNIGRGLVLEDCLFDYRIIGHYIYQGNN